MIRHLLRIAMVCSLALLISPNGFAARDFLSADEVELVRLAQEPNQRLLLYADIAGKRLKLVEQMLEKEKAGRSLLIHDALEDYVRILDAMDIVAEDSLKRNADLTESMTKLSESYKELLTKLKDIEEREPLDISRYEFVLANAIDTTEDAIEVTAIDLRERKIDVAAREEKQDKVREELMTTEEREAKKEQAAKEEKAEKKRPSLFKKGEKPPEKR